MTNVGYSFIKILDFPVEEHHYCIKLNKSRLNSLFTQQYFCTVEIKLLVHNRGLRLALRLVSELSWTFLL